jgi:hypothetical protein
VQSSNTKSGLVALFFVTYMLVVGTVRFDSLLHFRFVHLECAVRFSRAIVFSQAYTSCVSLFALFSVLCFMLSVAICYHCCDDHTTSRISFVKVSVIYRC